MGITAEQYDRLIELVLKATSTAFEHGMRCGVGPYTREEKAEARHAAAKAFSDFSALVLSRDFISPAELARSIESRAAHRSDDRP